MTATDLGPTPSHYLMDLGGDGLLSLTRLHQVLGVVDKPAVNMWKLKRVAAGVATDESVAELARNGREWAAVQAVLSTDSPEAALGTAVHLATAAVDKGLIAPRLRHLELLRERATEREWPRMVGADEVLPYVEQWERCKRIHGLEVLDVERPVAHLGMGWAGTLDRILRAASLERPLPMVGDLKTGKGVWPEAAVQMGAYSHAEVRVADDYSSATPMPELDQELALVIHLHPTTARLVPVSIGEGWRAFRAALALHEWVSTHGPASIGDPLPEPPEREPEEWPW